MTDPFLTTNGELGEFFTRANRNRLDSNTAHILQGLGFWEQAPGSSTVEISADQAFFGATSLKVNMNGLDARVAYTAPGSDHIPVEEDSTYSIGYYLFTAEANREAFIGPQSFLDNINVGSFGTGPVIQLNPGLWTWVPGPVFTVGPGIDNMRYRVHVRVASTGDPAPDGEAVYLDAADIELGSSPEFWPSLNIVGVNDYRFDLDTVWDPTADKATAYRNTDPGGPPLCNLRTASRFGVQMAGDPLLTTLAHGFVGQSRRSIRILADPASGVTAQEDVGAGFVTIIAGGAPWTPSRPPGELSIMARSSGGSQFNLAADIYSLSLRDGEDGPPVYVLDPADVLAAL